MPREYYVDQARLLLWLCPAAMLLIPFAIRLRSDGDEGSRFLAVGAASMLIFQAVWKAANGVFDDWNLYAIGGLFIALCVWRYAAAVASTRWMQLAAALLAVAGSLNTYTWIMANHGAVR